MAPLAALATPQLLTALSTAAGVAGAGVSAIGTIASGNAQAAALEMQRQALEYEAAQLDIKATEERAAAQREAGQLRRQKKLALSSLQARSAASGFSADDPSTLDLAGDIAQYGTLQEQMVIFGGESRAEGLRAAAQGRRITGEGLSAEADAVRRGSRFSAAGTILGDISTLADRHARRASRHAQPPAQPSGNGYG